MKFIHTADLHLGAANNKLNSEQKKIMKEEQISAVTQLFNFARLNSVDFMLIAGDLFHSRTVSTKIVKAFFSQVEAFSKPVIYVRGNHDEEFEIKDIPSNFIEIEKFTTLDLGQVQVSGMSGTKGLNISKLEEDKKNVVLLHGDVYSNGNDYIDLKNLKNKNIDYLALGHLHSFQEKDFERGKLCYSGSLFGSGFDECGEKGFVFVTIDDKIQTKFVPLNVRQFNIAVVDITGVVKFEDLISRVKEALSGIDKKDLVRVILQGYFEENTEKFLNLLYGKFSSQFYLEIIDESKLKIDFEKYKGEELSFKAELLRLIEADNSLTEADKSKIGQISIEALRGDDLSI